MYLGVEVISELQPVEVGGQVFNMGDVDEGLRSVPLEFAGLSWLSILTGVNGCSEQLIIVWSPCFPSSLLLLYDSLVSFPLLVHCSVRGNIPEVI